MPTGLTCPAGKVIARFRRSYRLHFLTAEPSVDLRKTSLADIYGTSVRIVLGKLHGDRSNVFVDGVECDRISTMFYFQALVVDAFPRLVSNRALLCQAPACEVLPGGGSSRKVFELD